jgi:ferritin-like protein
MKRSMQTIEVLNRTGSMLKPDDTAALAEITASTPPSSSGDGRGIATMRNAYSTEGLPIGHEPPPPLAPAKGRGKKGGTRQAMLLDKMGERLAFERSGTRLYEALLAKFDGPGAISDGRQGIDRSEIEEICAEEHAHFQMLVEAIAELGGDPTALTPSADVAAVASCGLPKVLLDPRTTFKQCLEAILIAELTDNDAWQMLAELAEADGKSELAERFRGALEAEAEHLARVRGWLGAAMLGTTSSSRVDA